MHFIGSSLYNGLQNIQRKCVNWQLGRAREFAQCVWLPSSNFLRELFTLAAEPGVRACAICLAASAQCTQSHVHITGSSFDLKEMYNDSIILPQPFSSSGYNNSSELVHIVPGSSVQ